MGREEIMATIYQELSKSDEKCRIQSEKIWRYANDLCKISACVCVYRVHTTKKALNEEEVGDKKNNTLNWFWTNFPKNDTNLQWSGGHGM